MPETISADAPAVTIRHARMGDDATVAMLIADYAQDFEDALGEQDVVGEGMKALEYYEKGALLVAEMAGDIVGCVAYEPWGDKRARMKRLYVLPDARGNGVGRALALGIMDTAREGGSTVMVLDTTKEMKAARALYRDLGFEEWDADYEAPCVGTVYMRRDL